MFMFARRPAVSSFPFFSCPLRSRQCGTAPEIGLAPSAAIALSSPSFPFSPFFSPRPHNKSNAPQFPSPHFLRHSAVVFLWKLDKACAVVSLVLLKLLFSRECATPPFFFGFWPDSDHDALLLPTRGNGPPPVDACPVDRFPR